MCGIAGWLGAPGRQVPNEVLERMIRSAKHRGPDGEGFYRQDNVGLAHGRLAILDLSANGAQPFIDGDLVLVYNGEIYNYIEIRAELEKLGHVFRSNTDTEVLLKAYREWGGDALSRCNGMFAFAIWDANSREIFAARDRFGVKPFYYRMVNGALLFASEIRQILAVSERPAPNESVVADYLIGTLIDHGTETFFQDISRLPAGAWMTWSAQDGRVRKGIWYELKRKEQRFSVDEIQSLILDSIQLRKRSDVRVGTCLSGGIDSSTLAWWAGRGHQANAQEKFFGITASSLDPRNDETAFAEQVAISARLDWHCVQPTKSDFIRHLDELIWTQEEPFGGPSLFMQYFVMQKAREQGCTVLLDGQGGDEVFMGYPKYVQPLLRGIAQEQGLGAAWRRLRELKNNANLSEAFLLKILGKHFATQAGWSGSFELQSFLRADLLAHARHSILQYRTRLADPETAQIQDLASTNLPQLLRYEDKNSMRHSIEARLPFLDYRVVEYGVGLSMDDKSKGGWLKAPIRQWMTGKLPGEVLWRKDKIGFAAPESIWGNEYAHILAREWSHLEKLRNLLPGLDQEKAQALSRSSQWKLINLAIWMRMDLNEASH